MMRKDYWKTWFLVLLGVGLLVFASVRINTIKQLRRDYDLDPADSYMDDEAAAQLGLPLPVFSIFRSLAIDYLWIRADNLKNAGQYFDALHLARLICALQPESPKVWDFQAWNMAYNISVSMPNPPERWHWIEAGFKLLRDEGLVANPRSPMLYHKLSWIFQHKIGGISDDYHRYYKERLAHEMMTIFGTDRSVTNEHLAAWAAAPRSWATLKNDPNVVVVVNEIKQAVPELSDDEQVLQAVLRIKFNPNDASPQLHQVLSDHQFNPALLALDRFVRARALRQEWKLEPALMLEVNRQYGPEDLQIEGKKLGLDWRLPWCHALYWAKQGLNFAEANTVAHRDLVRAVYHNIISLYQYGTLQIYAVTAPALDTERQTGQEIVDKKPRTELRVFNSQDLRMFPAVYQAVIDEMQALIDAGEEVPKGMESAISYMVWDAVSNLYLVGYESAARRYYQRLGARFPENQEYQVALEMFIWGKMREEIKDISSKKAAAYVDSMLRRSYSFAAVRNDELAQAYEKRAQKIHQICGEYFQDEQDTDRMRLPEFPEMRFLALQHVLDDPAVNPDIKGLLMARLQQERPQDYESIMNALRSRSKSSDGAPPLP
jgi:hypothetical protein